MAEVFVEFENPVIAPDGTAYHAQACGAPAADGTNRWEGWVEFVPVDGGDPLRSKRETTQPNRDDTAYWATGLSPVFLRGTLERTLNPGPVTVETPAPAESLFDGPAPSGALPLEPTVPSVLNPFSVYRKGEAMLRSQLSALSAWHLVNIIRAYDLSERRVEDLETLRASELVETIVAAVRMRAAE